MGNDAPTRLPQKEACNSCNPDIPISSEQRNSEARRALYIQLHMVLLAWNLDQAARIPSDQHPTAQLWQQVLVRPVLPSILCNGPPRRLFGQ